MAKKTAAQIAAAAKKAAAKRAADAKKAAEAATAAESSYNKAYTENQAANTAPNIQSPVASSTGKIASPSNWQEEQALLSRGEESDQIDADSAQYAIDYENTKTDLTTQKDRDLLDISKKRTDWENTKNGEFSSLNNNLAYRGASRSSAAAKQTGELILNQDKIANDFTTAAANRTADFNTAMARAQSNYSAQQGSITRRKQAVSNKAAMSGSNYIEQAGAVESGVNSPTISGASTTAQRNIDSLKGTWDTAKTASDKAAADSKAADEAYAKAKAAAAAAKKKAEAAKNKNKRGKNKK